LKRGGSHAQERGTGNDQILVPKNSEKILLKRKRKEEWDKTRGKIWKKNSGLNKKNSTYGKSSMGKGGKGRNR